MCLIMGGDAWLLIPLDNEYSTRYFNGILYKAIYLKELILATGDFSENLPILKLPILITMRTNPL